MTKFEKFQSKSDKNSSPDELDNSNIPRKYPLFALGLPKINDPYLSPDDFLIWDEDIFKNRKQERDYYLDIHYAETADTEYYSEKSILRQVSRIGLSTQIKGVSSDAPRQLFWHSKHADELNAARINVDLKPFPTVQSEFHFVDYLNLYGGISAKIIPVFNSSELDDLSVFTYTRYSFFDTAELLMVCSGRVKEEIRKNIKMKKIFQRRRVVVEQFFGDQSVDFIEFESVCLEINGQKYKLRLRIIDISAMHGIAGYADVAANVGYKLEFKDLLSKKDKGDMLNVALDRPKDFEDYALGDLDVFDILKAYNKKWSDVYAELGIDEYFRSPKLTIGSSVKDLFEASLAKRFNIAGSDEKQKSKWKKTFNEVIAPFLEFNPGILRQESSHTRALLAKVEGGRCRNNRPTAITINRKMKGKYDTNIICDIDISGCYGEGLRNQKFFLGKPKIIDLRISKNNQYPTLREVLNSLKVKIDLLCKKNRDDWENPENWGQLSAGSWYFRISTKAELKYPQDLIASWFTSGSFIENNGKLTQISGHGVDVMAKFIKNMPSDTALVDKVETVDFDEEYGSTKIFENEIHNGVLTHDILQWIFGICSPRQRNEFLDNVTVVAGAYYPRSLQIDAQNLEQSITEIKNYCPDFDFSAIDNFLVESSEKEINDWEKSFWILNHVTENWKGKNKIQIISERGTSITTTDECHFWIGIDIGDLLVNGLLSKRKTAQIINGKKSPMDILFKLCTNTTYGDLVSPYFTISNPIVGNNITARARCLAWYMEKGFDGWESITDGCAFELNKVNYSSGNLIDGESTISNTKKRVGQWHIKQTPLGGVKEILIEWVDYQEFDKKKQCGVTKFVPTLHLQHQDDSEEIIESNLFPDKDNEGYFKGDNSPVLKWIDLKAWEHLREQFPCIDILHSETTSISVKKSEDGVNVDFKKRVGQFSFETKDIYYSGAFHGSANYILENPNSSVVKMRGYETTRTHESFSIGEVDDSEDVDFLPSERYNENNNPGKDFMNNLHKNPTAIKRQETAVKFGILKIGEYAGSLNIAQKFDDIKIEPGDEIKKSLLMQEFSLTQFTFKTYAQYMSWKKVIERQKDENRQSLETFFLNSDGTLNFQKMVDNVYEMIQKGVSNPLKELDKNKNKHRKNHRHPDLGNYEKISKRLKSTSEELEKEVVFKEVEEQLNEVLREIF